MRATAQLQKSHLIGCAWFWAWAFVGAAIALGMLSLGPLLVVPAVVAAWLLARKRPINGAFGVLSGAGIVLLVIAYIQRDGPGTTCWQTATAAACDQHLNPLPFLVAGLICFAAGIAGHAWRSR
jgi:hypothetical protein